VNEGETTEMPPIHLIRGANLTGVVYGTGRQPLPGASVQLQPAENNFEGHRVTRSDASGRYLLENVRPGTYKLTATKATSGNASPFEAISDMRLSEIEVSIEDGGRHEVDLNLDSAAGN
jgi:hypothetical protein